MPFFEQISLSELQIEYSELEEAIASVFGVTNFAAKKTASAGQPKKRNCNPAKSIPCGNACVRKASKSGKPTQCKPKGGLKDNPDAKQASDWLDAKAPLGDSGKDIVDDLLSTVEDDPFADELDSLLDDLGSAAKIAKPVKPVASPPNKIKQTGKLNGSHANFKSRTVDPKNRSDIPDLDAIATDVAKKTGMTVDEAKASVQAIAGFSGIEYGLIRKDEKAGRENKKIDDINRFLERAPRYKGGVERGMAFSDEDYASFISSVKGNDMVLDSMSSFSSSSKIAEEFTFDVFKPKKVILRVASNKSGVSIKPFSNSSREDEVLVPKGARYTLKGLSKRDVVVNGVKHTIDIVDLEEVN